MAEIEAKRLWLVGLRLLDHLVDDLLVVGLGDQPAGALGALVRRPLRRPELASLGLPLANFGIPLL
jgi:hypothetical protein